MAFMTIEKAKMYKTAYCPKYSVYVSIEDAWKNLNGQTIFLCRADSNVGFDGDYCKKVFMQTELTKFCL